MLKAGNAVRAQTAVARCLQGQLGASSVSVGLGKGKLPLGGRPPAGPPLELEELREPVSFTLCLLHGHGRLTWPCWRISRRLLHAKTKAVCDPDNRMPALSDPYGESWTHSMSKHQHSSRARPRRSLKMLICALVYTRAACSVAAWRKPSSEDCTRPQPSAGKTSCTRSRSRFPAAVALLAHGARGDRGLRVHQDLIGERQATALRYVLLVLLHKLAHADETRR